MQNHQYLMVLLFIELEPVELISECVYIELMQEYGNKKTSTI